MNIKLISVVGKSTRKSSQLMSTNPKKAFEELWESESFMKALRKGRFSRQFIRTAYQMGKALKKKIPTFLQKQIDKIGAGMSYLSNSLLGNIYSYGVGKLKSWKGFKKGSLKTLGKFGEKLEEAGGKATKFLGKSSVGLGIDKVTNVAWDYSQQGDKGDLNKAATDGTIDTIANIGPVDGAIMLSGLGFGGMALGAGLGAAIQVAQFVNPHLVDDTKKNVHNFEKGFGSFSKKAGNDVKNTVNNIGKAAKKINWGSVRSIF